MRMKVMVVGPTEIEDDIRQAGAAHQVYNRTPEFSEFVLGVESKLKRLFKTENDVYFLSCSGTGIMECALVNFLSPGDKVIVLSGGVFGDRWLEIGAEFGLQCIALKVQQGQAADLSRLTAALTPDVKAVFVTANETSTGTLCDLENIGQIVNNSGAILIVDAVSSLGASPLESDAWHCDVVCSSTHKALAVPPGIGLISVSAKAWRHSESAKLPKYYFDLRRYKLNLTRGQTPFTPAISLLYQLDARLDKILDEGLDQVVARHEQMAVYLRTQLRSIDIDTFDIAPANGMVGIRFGPDIDASAVVDKLRSQFKIQITPSPEPDKHRIARVGLFGNLGIRDIDTLVSALRAVIGR